MSVHRDIELMAAGWDRRFEADVSRLDEIVQMYTEMGYEVTTSETVPDDFGPDCAGCAIAASCQRYVVVYTRTPVKEVVESGR
jgi:hypothetical protein